ncbi:MAG: endonuclease/exonuclease/phosphatase family protein [Prevotella sp.]|nr:endonuclease/exonuclease/phosphatase family protein [Prevotella sp.]
MLTLLLASLLTLVELNCENLFDYRHDEGKQDVEWMPDGQRRWSPARYWLKLNHIGQEILSCQEEGFPDLVAMVEVENDSCLHDLTRRSLLRHAGYRYLMTSSPDVRGIDVALLYQPRTFRPLCYDCMEVEPLEGMRPTRDILYVQGETVNGDTLHVFVVHAPSRFGGERATRPNRRVVMERLIGAVSQLPSNAKVIVAGDFNDYADSPSLKFLEAHGLRNVTARAVGTHGAEGTYRYEGRWQSIDHVLVSAALVGCVGPVYVNDAPFLLEDDKRYGGVKPLRTFNGLRYQRGFSDHLPLVVRLRPCQ